MTKLSECSVWWWSKSIARMIAEQFGEDAAVECYERRAGGYAGTVSGAYILIGGKVVADYRQRTNDIVRIGS